jgi:prolipoprotein diacylglyceryl transferase
MKSFIPTPGTSVFELGFLTLHFYAICILLGIISALWLTKRRYRALGGNAEEVSDLALLIVPIGIIGGRLYHVVTSPQKYFGSGGSPLSALKIWQGGLGIWGAISLGGLAALFYYKKRVRSLSFISFADAIAPSLLIAQGLGRFGNWFNGELFGRPTSIPWALEIPAEKRPIGFENFTTFHPTFLYEAIWCFFIAAIILRLKLFKKLAGTGAIFTFYVASYSFGRLFIVAIRIDEANMILGLRLNIWVAATLFLGAGALFLREIAKYRKK